MHNKKYMEGWYKVLSTLWESRYRQLRILEKYLNDIVKDKLTNSGSSVQDLKEFAKELPVAYPGMRDIEDKIYDIIYELEEKDNGVC